MNVIIGVLAFVGMLAAIASIVLAGIAAVVEILPPPLRNPEADDHGAGTPVAVTVRSHQRMASSRAHPKPRTRLSH